MQGLVIGVNMNIDNGHLARFAEKVPEGYEPVPEEYTMQVELELAGKKETTIGLKSSGTLSRWAKTKREKRKKLAMAGKR